jgi:hypothetical protein
MTRKKKLITNWILTGLFVFFFVCFLFRVKGAFTTTVYYPKTIERELSGEEFDITLMRLNTIDKLINYCDSVHQANAMNRTYPGTVSEVIRKRFYHGYSFYSLNDNPVGYLIAAATKKGIAALVIPDDIAKHPNAACSQQSIVGMEIFKRKGYQVRKVVMFDKVAQSGHFAYEVYYDNGWHYFDTDAEPDSEVLKKNKRPSTALLAKHPEIVAAAYHKQPEFFVRLIQSHATGPVDEFPAPNAYAFQQISKFLTYFGWAIVFGFFLLIRWRREFKAKLHFDNPNMAILPKPIILTSRA